MKKLQVSYSDLYAVHQSIVEDKALSPTQFMHVVNISFYTVFKEKVVCTEAKNFVPKPKLEDLGNQVDLNLLIKSIYYMDATSDVDDSGNILFRVGGVYKLQLLTIFTCLLKNKPLVFSYTTKHIRTTLSFLEKTYHSILEKLNFEPFTLEDKGYLSSRLQDFIKKAKNVDFLVVDHLFTVLHLKTITQVSFYSKYDDFDKEFCTNFRFKITKSTSTKYPIGRFVFGVIKSNDTNEVVIYKDSECLFPIENE